MNMDTSIFDFSNLLLALYFALGIAIFQYLHCHYVSNHPRYLMMGLGWPWSNSAIAFLKPNTNVFNALDDIIKEYSDKSNFEEAKKVLENIKVRNKSIPLLQTYSFQSTVTLFVCCFFIALAALDIIPPFGTYNFIDVLFPHLTLVIIVLLALVAFSQIMGPAGLKGLLSLILIFLVMAIIYTGSNDRNVTVIFGILFVLFSFTFSMGTWWIGIMSQGLTPDERFEFPFKTGLYVIGSCLYIWIAGCLLIAAMLLGYY